MTCIVVDIDSVRVLLDDWQAPHLAREQSQRENKAGEREENRQRRIEQRRQELYLRIITGGSQNYKQYVVTQFRKQRDDPFGKLWLMLYAAYQPQPKKGERKWERFRVPQRVTGEQIQAEYKALMERPLVRTVNPDTAGTQAPVVNRLKIKSGHSNRIAASGDGEPSGGAVMRTPTLKEQPVCGTQRRAETVSPVVSKPILESQNGLIAVSEGIKC